MTGLKDEKNWWAKEKHGQILSKTSKETKESMLESMIQKKEEVLINPK